jgi:homogentisate 1,2-dioxygenase
VLYYVEGNYKARKGIEPASITLHPQGIAHGPHPGTVEKSLGAKETSELAVMCDTFRPLFPTKAAVTLDDMAYPRSWEGEHFPVSLGQHLEDGSHKPNGKVNGKSHGRAGAGNAEAKPSRSGVADTWE